MVPGDSEMCQTPCVPWYDTALAVLGVLFLTCLAPPEARPYRGSVQWSVLLCNFTDSSTPPRDVAFYEDMIVRPWTGGLDDYLFSVSYGNANLEGTVVRGWYTIPYTLAEENQRGAADRGQPFWDCVNAAQNSPTAPYMTPAGQLV